MACLLVRGGTFWLWLVLLLLWWVREGTSLHSGLAWGLTMLMGCYGHTQSSQGYQ